MANFTQKQGRPLKGAQIRDIQVKILLSQQELELFDETLKILDKRRSTGKSRSDFITYLVEREHEKQQNIKPF